MIITTLAKSRFVCLGNTICEISYSTQVHSNPLCDAYGSYDSFVYLVINRIYYS